MTSVQNRPLLLSGNNAFVLGLVLLLFTACDLLAPLQQGTSNGRSGDNTEEEEDLGEVRGGRVYNPDTGEYEDAETVLADEMVTIRWEAVPTSEYEPIGSERTSPIDDEDDNSLDGIGADNPDLRERYNVALLLPFLTNRFTSEDAEIDRNSRWAIQFYAGARLALAKLEEEGVNLNVDVLDTEANPTVVNTLLQEPA
ncbi:MAG: hypothetical protein AAF738_02770, partial [Bacteroidota bacterium]